MNPFPDAGFLTSPAEFSTPGTFRCRISPDSRLFDGHFEGAPILPGVAHIALALRACAAGTGVVPALGGIRDLRFRRPLGPGSDVEVVLSEDRDPSCTRFEIRCEGELASTGVLRLIPAGPNGDD